MRNRKEQRALRKAGIHREERLDSRNCYGLKDPTPKQAIQNIINKTGRGYRKAVA